MTPHHHSLATRIARVAFATTTTIAFLACAAACGNGKQTFTTSVELVQVEPLADKQLGIELRYADCPGDGRRVLRTDKAFTACAGGLKAGDKVPAEIVMSYAADRGTWRSDITKLGTCALKLDPKEEANYEMYQSCAPIQTTGATVGIRCDRTRNAEAVAKCPWLRRK